MIEPTRLGEHLARLVWESFTDFLEAGTGPDHIGYGADLTTPDLDPEELLILFLWVHTRTCQQVFAQSPEQLRKTLDALHRAVFEDMEAHGMPYAEIALFEQRVSARYNEYYGAVDGENGDFGSLAAERVSGKRRPELPFKLALAEATLRAADPLRDYLNDLVLIA